MNRREIHNLMSHDDPDRSGICIDCGLNSELQSQYHCKEVTEGILKKVQPSEEDFYGPPKPIDAPKLVNEARQKLLDAAKQANKLYRELTT